MADSSFPRRPKSAEGGSKRGRVLELASDEVPEPPSRPRHDTPPGLWTAGRPSDHPSDRSTTGEVVVFPLQPVTGTRTAVREPSGAHRRPKPIEVPADTVADAPERPPYLASELLRENLSPTYPYGRLVRFASLVGGLAIVLLALLGGFQQVSLAVAGIGVSFAIVALIPLNPITRGWAVGAFAAGGLAVAARFGSDLTLAIAGALATGALLFRAAHRILRVGRVLVAVAIAGVVVWWVGNGGISSLVIASGAWQSILPALANAALVVLAVVTTLTFLDPLGTGGGRGFAMAWLLAVAVQLGTTLSLSVWPMHGAALPLGDVRVVAQSTCAIFVALAAVALPQGCASIALRIRRG